MRQSLPFIQNNFTSFSRLYSGGRIPYTIDADFTSAERAVIAASMADIEAVSCVRYEPRIGTENPSVRIKKDEEGCFAHVGAHDDSILNLGSGCVVRFFSINSH